MKKTLCLIATILCVSLSSFGQTKWKIDPVHSNIQFEVSHLAISTVTGKFSDFECTVESKRNSFEDAKIDAVVQVKSLTTDNLTRDKHLKEDDFFNAEKYPIMTFKSESFVKKTDTQYQVTGWLTIRDVTKKVSFPAEYSGMAKLGEKTISAFKANFVINRFDYNLTWSDTIDTGSLVVGEEVKVKLNLELVKI
ncbi:YceI family protein [Reichenbachiella agarivorans]|uniref:YceI family protein n=1 Tax=Reichenbachiella agarivorans TaxID=2979464 RepID=A0ABY6CNI8_9BACT|nr:YceI family protein [Reichenbachiella agarivorans]UXP31600.1 YceI family protein [Reichenbachiella agarivorans]